MVALHIEDKMQYTIGKLLCDSWWTTVITQSGVLTSGRAVCSLNIALNVHGMSKFLLFQCTYCYGMHILNTETVLGPPESLEMWIQYKQNAPVYVLVNHT